VALIFKLATAGFSLRLVSQKTYLFSNFDFPVTGSSWERQ